MCSHSVGVIKCFYCCDNNRNTSIRKGLCTVSLGQYLFLLLPSAFCLDPIYCRWPMWRILLLSQYISRSLYSWQTPAKAEKEHASMFFFCFVSSERRRRNNSSPLMLIRRSHVYSWSLAVPRPWYRSPSGLHRYLLRLEPFSQTAFFHNQKNASEEPEWNSWHRHNIPHRRDIHLLLPADLSVYRQNAALPHSLHHFHPGLSSIRLKSS